ncbi:hypothetical protein [Gracilimonas sediminicola]|uniref:Uncharacterized protein n=1 Tax=Gracilimonas sediminicola TaxID=2952158 RepID=A0A9X2L207_9BACT|nr:hypothetical protein [Gracilimonas sediminicola]MCP9290835.1 hypothetical protein [Gracilimonas sediminicola]
MNTSTDIFKLFFHHDQRLDKLPERTPNKKSDEMESTLEDFMKPDPTYSKFYLTGTDLAQERFGLNMISGYEKVIAALEKAFPDENVFTANGKATSISNAVSVLELGEVFVLAGAESTDLDIESLHIDINSNVGHLKEELKEALEDGHIVVYKEQAKDGFDLHIFSKENIYTDMFYPFQELVPDTFRFFSINGKKFRSERHFYFETWTLDRPPHGFEEVHPESVL